MGKLVFQSKGVSDETKRIALKCSAVMIAIGLGSFIIARVRHTGGIANVCIGIVILLGVGVLLNIKTEEQSFFKIYTDKIVGQTCVGFWIFTVKKQFEIDYRRITNVQMISNPLIGDVINVKANGERYGLIIAENAEKAYGILKKIVEYYEKRSSGNIKTENHKDNKSNYMNYDSEINSERKQNIKFEFFPAKWFLGREIEKIIGYVGVVLVCIVAFRYLHAGISEYEMSDYAFGFVSEDVRPLGYMLHWGVVVAYFCFVIEYIWLIFLKKKMAGAMIMTGVPMCILTLVMFFGRLIYEEIEYKDIPIIMYRVFGVYAEVNGFAFFVSIALIVVGLGMAKVMQMVDDKSN